MAPFSPAEFPAIPGATMVAQGRESRPRHGNASGPHLSQVVGGREEGQEGEGEELGEQGEMREGYFLDLRGEGFFTVGAFEGEDA